MISSEEANAEFVETQPRVCGPITEITQSIIEEDTEVNILNTRCVIWDDYVPFPNIGMPMIVSSREYELAEEAEREGTVIIVANKKPGVEMVMSVNDLNPIAVSARVVTCFRLPDDNLAVTYAFGPEVELKSLVCSEPPNAVAFNFVKHERWDDKDEVQKNLATLQLLHERFEKMLKDYDGHPHLRMSLSGFKSFMNAGHLICSVLPTSYENRLTLLNETDLQARFTKAIALVEESMQSMEIRRSIQEKTRVILSDRQREHFLREEMETLRGELAELTGEDDFVDPERAYENVSGNPDIRSLIERARKKEWNDETRQVFFKQLSNLDRIPMSAPDYSIQYTYLDNFLNLPWNHYSESDFTLDSVEAKLNADHYGLDKIKERILDHMAVVKLRGDKQSPILCLYGPPGIGKTSLGKSVAEALGRDYARVSLGGLHDEAEIRGHRRTYLGALPGRIISAMIKCKTSNPVIVLDEIDKIGRDMKGDPASALLEVLDPEQNSKFHDNYLDCDYDLSHVLFIATANTLETVSAPLRDRMELVEITGYIAEEKVEIAKRHLVPRALEAAGLAKDETSFSTEAIRLIIDSYTRESGVRLLNKKLVEALRKVARMKVCGKEIPTVIEPEHIRSFFGKETVVPDVYENNDYAGVVTGLAWTSVGGEILFIETSLSKGKGERLTLTGNLGDVMKESATIAVQYLKAHAEQLGIPEAKFTEYDIHVHVPEGAIPKDGPSAGITMATSIASALTGRKVRANIAMTGEITLRGKVLPVGGIKEKILAAKRAGITDIMLSEKNRKDIEEIGEVYLEGLSFHFVDRVEQVLDYALLDEQAPF